MADVNANIDVNINTSDASAQLKALQRQISQFHTSISKSSEAAALAQKSLQRNLLNNINAIGAFSAELRTVKTTAESFTASLEGNKFSMREYFRYAGASTKTFGKLFKSEFDTIGKVAEDRVKKLQTQYIKLGRDSSGAMKALAVMPDKLDLTNYSTQTQLAAQRQAVFNQLMKQGSTNLLNFGKNTQWAGRQLMVGFSLPLMAVGSTATKTFMEMEAQALKFKKVYGDLFTPKAETQAALDGIKELGMQFTRYGIAVSQTVGLAADAAAAGFQGLDLQRQTTEATRLSVLGQIDSQQALQTTISLQNAFQMSSENLAGAIDFLNAVENQTVLSLDDVTTAIPKVAPVIQQLGGDVKDLAFFLTAMKEGGVNASEGANALKSGLASLINPTAKARDMLAGLGIDINGIVQKNKGDLKATVIGFAQALDTLDPLTRARAIEQMFGKFQFARLSTLFQNVTKDGTQASRVLDLAGTSLSDLASLSQQELGVTADSAMNKFKKSVEDLKVAIVPVGEAFLQAITPIIDFVGNLLDKFSGLSDGTKKFITLMTVGVGGLGPILLMTFGLLANGIANIAKLFLTLRQGYLKLTGQSQILGEQTQYLTNEQLDAAAVAHSLGQSHATLTQTFTAEATAVQQLVAAYEAANRAGRNFAITNPGMMAPRVIRKMADGGIVSGPGTGRSDSIPTMLSNGEAVIPAASVAKNQGLVKSLVSNNIPSGRQSNYVTNTATSVVASHFDVTAPSVLGQTIRDVAQELGDFKVSVFDVSKNIEDTGFDVVKTQRELRNVGAGSNAVVAGGETFAGTTKASRGSRNIMFNALGIAGEPFTLDSLVAAGKKAEEKLNSNSKVVDKHRAELEILAEEGKNASELLKDSNNATKSRIDYMRNNAKSAITEATLADARKKIDGKAITVAQAKALAEEKLLKIDQELATLKASGVSDEKIIEKARKAHISEMLKSGTGEFVESPVGTGGGYGRDVASGRGRSGLFRQGRAAGERMFAYGGRKIKAIEQKTRAALVANAAVDANVYEKEFNKLVQDPYKVSRQRNSANPLAAKDGKDDAIAYSKTFEAVSAERISQSKQMLYRSQGPIDPVQKSIRRQGEKLSNIKNAMAISPQMQTQLNAYGEKLKTATARLEKMNGALMGGAFALTTLAGAGTMFGGTVGDISNKIFQLSGTVFGLMSVMQMFTKETMASIIAQRLKRGAEAVTAATAAGGIASRAGMFGSLARFGTFAKGLLGLTNPLGLIATGLILSVGAFKLLSKAQADAKEKVEGLGNAAVLSGDKLKTLGDFFGIVPTKLPYESLGSQKMGMSKQQQSRVDELRSSDGFKKDFKKDISALKKTSSSNAKMVLESMGIQLKARGFAQDQIKTIIQALQIESGKTDLKLDFKNIGIVNDKNIKAQSNLIIKKFANAFAGGDTKVVSKTLGNILISSKTVTEFTKSQQALMKAGASSMFGIYQGLIGQLQNGTIDATNFNKQISILNGQIESMPKAAQLQFINSMFEKLGPAAVKATAGIKGTHDQLNAFLALSYGGIDVDSKVLEILSNPEKYSDKVLGRAQNQLSQSVKKGLKLQKLIADATAKEAGTTTNTTTGTSSDVLSKEAKLTIARLKEELRIQKGKRDAIKETNDELKRQYDYQQQISQLTQDATQAKISGNYIQAAMIEQQKTNVALEYKRETDSRELDKRISDLEDRISALSSGERLSAAEQAYLAAKKKASGLAGGGLIKGPGTSTSDSILGKVGFARGGFIGLSNNEYVVNAAAVKNYGVPFMNMINGQKLSKSAPTTPTNSGSTVYNIDMTINGGGANAKEIADQVMKRISMVAASNNKTNRVGM